MTIYFHNTESFLEYDDVAKQFYSGAISGGMQATAIDSRNGEIIKRGPVKRLVEDLK